MKAEFRQCLPVREREKEVLNDRVMWLIEEAFENREGALEKLCK